jgi:acetyl-CoA acetyltransferase
LRSGLKAVALAAQAIETGNSSIVVAGGLLADGSRTKE